MTSLHLLLWIVGAILLQLAIYMTIGFWRHWQTYEALRTTVIDAGLPGKLNDDPVDSGPVAAAWAGWRAFKVTHKVMENASQDICSFHLAPQDGQPLPAFMPGQYLTFRLAIASLQGGTESITRCYSLSDGPRSNGYRISIKRAPAPPNSAHPPGRSSNFFHDLVHLDSLLQVRAPAGHFHIDHSDAPVVLLGGGIGITPMLSMVNWCIAERPEREVWLFYGARHDQELMAHAHLEALADLHSNFHLYFCLSDTDKGTALGSKYQHQGRVDIDLLRRLLPLKPYHFYLCGPTPMLASLVPALEDWGVPDARIHFEAFGPACVKRKSAALAPGAAAPAPSADTAVMVTFAKSGRQEAWQPGSGNLLAFAEALGIAVDSGCRAGSCGSCQTSIRHGEVSYAQAPDFDPDPGNCLMCVCTPKTPLTLEL
ncbi:2Fe-2S iron-sulfur cluster-binding protein [Rhodoferax antarcticus]|uniref:2Fe-2S iron-sulfur cluster-binding protein n=1 Tax=Rhodoferax antarcticus TaxID=81479 RepID=UPI0022244E48|nr:2Fe-2S iron-sulfur cluster-binding protein [Rhodoferax antarcticus]MCW2310784.1 ferredoxin-NADP reductase [Rhodoferax antarcticus]